MPIDIKFTDSTGGGAVAAGDLSITAGSPSARAYTPNGDAASAAVQLPAFTVTGTGTLTVDISCVTGSGTFSNSATGTFSDTFTTSGDAATVTTALAAIWFKAAPGSNEDIGYKATVSGGGKTASTDALKVVNAKLTSDGKKSSTTVTLGGTTGSVRVTVNGVPASGVVAFSTNLDALVTAVVASINSTTSTPDYTATKINGTSFKLEAPLGLGSAANGLSVSGIVTGNITVSGSALSGGQTRVQPELTLGDKLLNGAINLLPTIGGIVATGLILKNMNKAQVTVPVTSETDKPDVAVVYQGIMVPVPVGYAAPTKDSGTWVGATYPASWDYTSFQTDSVYTNNVAWCLLEFVRNKRWGCGNVIKFTTDQLTQFMKDIYEAAQYCDELVSDGAKGLEPRFTLNTKISGMKRIDALQAIAQCMRGQVIFTDNGIRLRIDKPKTVKRLVTHANVINGEFSYATASMSSFANVIQVQWNNPDKYYRKEFFDVVDSTTISQGERRSQVVAFGCTSEGQARRFGNYYMLNEGSSSMLVSYTAGLDHCDLIPGDLVCISDWSNVPFGAPGNNGTRAVAGSSTTQLVTVEQSFAPPGPGIRFVHVTQSDGTYVTRTVQGGSQTATQTTLTLSTALPEAPNDRIWLYNSFTDLTTSGMCWMIVSIEENDDFTYNVTAIKYDPTKYKNIDTI